MDAPTPTPPAPDSARGLMLISRDMIFISKVTSTARALGREVIVAQSRARAETLLGGEAPPALVMIDLTSGDLASPENLAFYRALGAGAILLAFGPHVEVDALRAAKEAGCDHVWPRSKFTMQLSDLLTTGAPTTDR